MDRGSSEHDRRERVRIVFVKKIARSKDGRLILYIPKAFNVMISANQLYLITIEGPVELSDAEEADRGDGD